MLLHTVSRRVRRHGHEQGSALAAVVGIVVATAVVAATLLSTAVFATGFTSGSRAGVQAQAAAEAGIEFATANLRTCAGGVITSPAGSRPVFSVTVRHRTSATGDWLPCAPRGAWEVHLQSTGQAEHRGAAGHTRGDARAMVAVLRNDLPRAVVGDRSIRISGKLSLPPPTVPGPVEMSTNGDFHCNGEVWHTGTLYVGGLVNPKNAGSMCGRTGPLVSGAAVDPNAKANAFPKIYASDLRRWSGEPKTVEWLAATLRSSGTDPCTITATAATFDLGSQPVVVDATRCKPPTHPAGLTLSLNGKLVLGDDVVVIVEKLRTVAGSRLELASTGQLNALYLVKPWPTSRTGGCPAVPAPDFQTADLQLDGDLRSTDPNAAVMLYSSTGIVTWQNSSKNPVTGQVYACALNLQGAEELRFKALGLLLPVSRRDVPVGG